MYLHIEKLQFHTQALHCIKNVVLFLSATVFCQNTCTFSFCEIKYHFADLCPKIPKTRSPITRALQVNASYNLLNLMRKLLIATIWLALHKASAYIIIIIHYLQCLGDLIVIIPSELKNTQPFEFFFNRRLKEETNFYRRRKNTLLRNGGKRHEY